MKRKFSLIAAVMASVMFIAIGCSNASNITVTDTSKNGDFTEEGLSRLTVKIGETPKYRAILPEDWNPTSKANIGFKLTGEGAGNESIPDNSFLYANLENESFTIDILPIKWTTLTLTAYQLDKTKKAVDTKKPIMKAVVEGTNMSAGSKTVDFNLTPLSASEKEQSSACGDLDVQVKFTQVADAIVGYIQFDVVNVDESDLKQAITNPVTLTSEQKQVGTTVTEKFTQTYDVGAETGGIKAGDYKLKVTFKDSQGGKIMAQYITNLRIDGGNLSTETINMPSEAFNRAPKAPANLNASCYFAPSGDIKVVLDESKKLYAQDSTTSPSPNYYRVTFTWEDLSFNEEEFILGFTAGGHNFTIDKASVKSFVDQGTKITIPTDITNGDMGPDCTSITLQVPTGTIITAPTIKAKNAIGESGEGSKASNLASNIGMYTVEYDLTTPGGKAVVKNTKGEPKQTVNKYFIQAFDAGTNVTLLGKESNVDLYVFSDKFNFNHWYADGDVSNKASVTEVKTIAENKKFIGVWTTNLTVKLTYPSYTEYKDLKGATEANTATVITPATAGKVTLTIPPASGHKIENVVFSVKKPFAADKEYIYDSKTNQDSAAQIIATLDPSKDQSGGDNIVWDVKTYYANNKIGGIYTVYISYTYDGVPVDGCYFIELK